MDWGKCPIVQPLLAKRRPRARVRRCPRATRTRSDVSVERRGPRSRPVTSSATATGLGHRAAAHPGAAALGVTGTRGGRARRDDARRPRSVEVGETTSDGPRGSSPCAAQPIETGHQSRAWSSSVAASVRQAIRCGVEGRRSARARSRVGALRPRRRLARRRPRATSGVAGSVIATCVGPRTPAASSSWAHCARYSATSASTRAASQPSSPATRRAARCGVLERGARVDEVRAGASAEQVAQRHGELAARGEDELGADVGERLAEGLEQRWVRGRRRRRRRRPRSRSARARCSASAGSTPGTSRALRCSTVRRASGSDFVRHRGVPGSWRATSSTVSSAMSR